MEKLQLQFDLKYKLIKLNKIIKPLEHFSCHFSNFITNSKLFRKYWKVSVKVLKAFSLCVQMTTNRNWGRGERRQFTKFELCLWLCYKPFNITKPQLKLLMKSVEIFFRLFLSDCDKNISDELNFHKGCEIICKHVGTQQRDKETEKRLTVEERR